MDFLTIHEASREFDLPSRVVRYRLHQLIQAGKLVEGSDYKTRVPASAYAAHLAPTVCQCVLLRIFRKAR